MERKDTTIGLHLWHNSLKNKESDDGKPEQTDNLTENTTASKGRMAESVIPPSLNAPVPSARKNEAGESCKTLRLPLRA